MNSFIKSFREAVIITIWWLCRKHVICSVILLCFFILIPDTGFAYSPEAEKDFFFVKERSQVVWPQGQGDRKFVIYDNYSYSPGPRSQLPLLNPYTNEFVPADIIIVNLPVTDFFRKNLMIEDQIANLLYANLRLRKLLEEYSRVQESAYELFHGMEGLGSYYYETAWDISSEQVFLKPAISSDSSNDTQLVKELKKWMAKSNRDKVIVRHAIPYIDNEKKFENSEQGRGPGSLTFKLSYEQNYTSPARRYRPTRYQIKKSGKISGLPDLPKPSYSSKGNGGSLDEEQGYPSEETRKEEGHYRYDDDSQKPWIEVLAINTIKYFKENKLEGLFFFLLIFIPIFVLISSKSR